MAQVHTLSATERLVGLVEWCIATIADEVGYQCRGGSCCVVLIERSGCGGREDGSNDWEDGNNFAVHVEDIERVDVAEVASILGRNLEVVIRILNEA